MSRAEGNGSDKARGRRCDGAHTAAGPGGVVARAVCAAEQTAALEAYRVNMSRRALHSKLLGPCGVGAPSGWWDGASDDPVRSIQGLGLRTNAHTNQEKVHSMLYTIAVVLLIMWLLGLVTSYTMGGFIHILLVFAVVMVLVNLISGRRAL
jgi:hypothetical protein